MRREPRVAAVGDAGEFADCRIAVRHRTDRLSRDDWSRSARTRSTADHNLQLADDPRDAGNRRRGALGLVQFV